MIWRENLPARVALATTGLLALVLAAVTASAYTITALMIRSGTDAALRAALPAAQGVLDRGEGEDERGGEHRRIHVLDPLGRVRSGSPGLPVDPQAVSTALREGEAFISLVDGKPRGGPDWWQALTPVRGEVRVIYALVGEREHQVVLQLAAPLGPVGELLPDLFKWLVLLGGAGALICGLIAWRMAGETYRPLRAITATADEITTRTLSLRIPQVWHDQTLRRLIGVLNEMVARLQSAFEAEGRFVAAAAHELRGPLSAMRAELEVSLRRERTPQEYREALAGALDETTRLSALSEHLLILARYERGAVLSMERDLPLAPLLERTAAEVRRSAGGEVAVIVPLDLTVDGDPVALERMVSNLARNGVEAGGSPVEVEAGGDAGGVWIQVRDRGRGIPAEALPHIFEPFYRADPARGRDGGTGLGLAIVKTVVDAHGGRIEVESRPRQGAIFRVWLPRVQRAM